ncbi:MAG: hypothetical protein J6P40_05925 [Oscillospiraceae bacterium]|nr:hypothetical protein [Oscillospiraceae bacterium]
MGKIDIIRKLTSRKFWVAVVGVVSGLLLAFKVDAETIENIGGIIMAAASAVAYIIGEGLVDANNSTIIEIAPGDQEK